MPCWALVGALSLGRKMLQKLQKSPQRENLARNENRSRWSQKVVRRGPRSTCGLVWVTVGQWTAAATTTTTTTTSPTATTSPTRTTTAPAAGKAVKASFHPRGRPILPRIPHPLPLPLSHLPVSKRCGGGTGGAWAGVGWRVLRKQDQTQQQRQRQRQRRTRATVSTNLLDTRVTSTLAERVSPALSCPPKRSTPHNQMG